MSFTLAGGFPPVATPQNFASVEAFNLSDARTFTKAQADTAFANGAYKDEWHIFVGNDETRDGGPSVYLANGSSLDYVYSPANSTQVAAAQAQAQSATDRVGEIHVYPIRNAIFAAFAAALPDGSISLIEGFFYQTDSTATGVNSCTNDLGVDGLIPFRDITAEHFGAAGNGSTDDTSAIQNAINLAATTRIGRVSMGPREYLFTKLYFQHDATNNPDFPTGNHRNGRITLIGSRAVDQPQLRFGIDPTGTVLRSTVTSGSALVWGNGSGDGVATARRCELRDLSIAGNTSGDLVDINGGGQTPLIENVTIINDGGNVLATSSAIRVRNLFYAGKVVNAHVQGGAGTGVRVEASSLVKWDTVNVTNCNLAWDIGDDPSDLQDTGFGTAVRFENCQARNSVNGVQLRGGRNIVLSEWWFEQNDGDYDLFIHGNASRVTLESLYFTSTELSVGHLIVGGNSGNAARDKVRQVLVDACLFNFCGPTTSQAGLVKRGSCDYLKVSRSAFKANSGNGIMIDTTVGITPTIMEDIDWHPSGASQAIGDALRVVDQTGSDAPWLVRGSGRVGFISADLDMSAWQHLPDAIACSTGSNITVTLPTDTSKFIGQTLALRKALAGNTLTAAGSINASSSVSVTDINASIVLTPMTTTRYAQLA